MKTRACLFSCIAILAGCSQPRSERPLTESEIAAVIQKCVDLGLESTIQAESYHGRNKVDVIGCHAEWKGRQ